MLNVVGFVVCLVLVLGFVLSRQVRPERPVQAEAELAAAREATAVEYGARQCMVTVARGDYDDFLRQLGWQRGGAR